MGWLLALGYRGRDTGAGPSPFWYDLRQIVLVLWTLAALVILWEALHQGLLGAPEMQVLGNGSSSASLRWFTDRVGAALPSVEIVSVPLLVYRAAMLAWALWIALSLLSWLRWGWGAFTQGGGWKKGPPRPPRPLRNYAAPPEPPHATQPPAVAPANAPERGPEPGSA